MAQPESDDLSQLMPNLRQRAQAEAASPANTAALREYIKVLGEKPSNVPAASTLPNKPRTGGLAPRAGSGRRPQRRYFTIKLRPVKVDAEAAAAAAEAAALDPEALKDALVEQARAHRHALLEASRRPGTGRVPRRREFSITLPLLPTEEELAAEAEAEAASAAVAAEEAAAAAELRAQLQEREAEAQQWEGLAAEEGVLAEHAACKARLANAGSPGAAQRSPSLQLEQGGSCEAAPGSMAPVPAQQGEELLEPGTSQRGQARTPGTSLYGRYTPMEGVPERLALLATRGKAASGLGAAPATAAASLMVRPAGTPAGFTPQEGIPERLPAFPAFPGASRMGSNASGRPSVDSPVEGLVLEGGARRRASGGAAPARLAEAGNNGGFGGFAPSPQATEAAAVHAPSPGALPAPAALLEQQAAQQAAQPAAADATAAGYADAAGDDFDDDMGGGFDDGGYYDDEPSPVGAEDADHLHMADAGVQTGASLDAEAAPGARGSPGAAAGELADYGNDGGFGADGYADGEYEDAGVPETSAAAQPRARRQTKDPGVRLRNELKRKSLASDPRIGRHEVLPGVRRSTRQKQEPLKWWLNEKKEFGRSHKTMPTVNNVVHKVPNTPWQTVTDIKRRPTKRQRAPTPHDLEDALATAEPEAEDAAAVQSEGEDEEEQQQQQEMEEQDGEAEQQRLQQRRSGSGGRQQAAHPVRQKQQPRRQARGAAAAAELPAAGSKAAKKAAAGASRKRQARR